MPEERDLAAGVVYLANLLTRSVGRVLERAHVTPQQWAVLSVIAAAGAPMSLVAVARKLAVSKQNMTGMVNRLEQLGLMERSDDPADLRASRVQLSRRGRALIEKVAPAYEQWLQALAGDFGERELQGLVRAVNRLIAQLEQRA